MISDLARKLLAEFIGMLLFALTVVAAVRQGHGLAPIAIGSVLMVMVYAGGHISGGHYNPAVSLAAYVRGRLPIKDLIAYWVAQLAGAAAGAGIGLYLVGRPRVTPPAVSGHAIGTTFVAEVVFTFALAYVVLEVATSKATSGNSYFGLAIGFTVVAGAVAVGAVSGGAFNPAIAFAASISGLSAWGGWWIYIVACLLGGAIAGVVFRVLAPDDK